MLNVPQVLLHDAANMLTQHPVPAELHRFASAVQTYCVSSKIYPNRLLQDSSTMLNTLPLPGQDAVLAGFILVLLPC